MPERDAPLQQAIAGVVAAHPTWGIRLIPGWLCGQGLVVPFSRLRRIYRQAGYAAQWRKRRKKIRRHHRINPVAQQPHDVWCMDFAEDRLINGRRFMALLVKDEATAYGLAIRVAPSFKSIDVESILDELVSMHGCPQFICLTSNPANHGRMVSQRASSEPTAQKFSTPMCFIRSMSLELSHQLGFTCTTTSVRTASITINHLCLLSQRMPHDHYFLNIELV